MSEPFIGQVNQVSFNVVPKGWAQCNGQLMSIAQNQALFSILGTTYGGDGITTFALPNLQGRTPVHPGNGITLGESAGEASHTLSPTETPLHGHPLMASITVGNAHDPTGAVLAAGADLYNSGPGNQMMDPTSISPTGGGQPHNNMQPYLAINFIIALTGIYPSRG